MKKLGFIEVISILILILTPLLFSQTMEFWYQKGVKEFNIEHYENAIKYFTKAIELNPRYAKAYYIRGKAYYNIGDQKALESDREIPYQKAIDNFTKAIEINPEYADAYNFRGIVYANKRDKTKARSDFTKAIDINQSNAYPFVCRGFLLYFRYNQGKSDKDKMILDKAIKDFSRAIEIAPKYAWAYYIRGRAYYKKKNYDKAILDLKIAIEIDPNFEKAWFYRGMAFKTKGQLDNAIFDLTRAIEINPKNAWAYFIRGRAYYNTGNYDKAILDYNKSLEIGHRDACFIYNRRGEAYLKKMQYNQAFKDFNRAKKLYPGNEWVDYNFARLYSIRKDKDNALKYFLSAISGGFDDFSLLNQNEDIDFIRNEEIFQKALEIVLDCSKESDPVIWCVNYKLACYFSLKKDKAIALDFLSSAIWYGFDNLSRINQDKDLDFIKNEKEFQEIIRKLEKKQN